MCAIAYGVGVGPGDPSLLTLKAVELIKSNEVIAVPGKNPQESVVYKIAVQAVPELATKTIISLNMPMVNDRAVMRQNHVAAVKTIESYLDKGQNVVYLTLGDSTIYCTFTYLQSFLEADGYRTQLVNGITSFCAAAAKLNIPLVEWEEALHIIPAVHQKEVVLEQSGNYVLMKSGSQMQAIKEHLKKSNREICVVENCGMANERVYQSIEAIPDDAGYFSLIIVKEKKK